MEKVVFYTIADKNNLPYANMLGKTLAHFHPDIPFVVYGDKEIVQTHDPNIFYRATPYFGLELIKKYDLVIKIDADSLLVGDLNHIFTKPFDVATVYNWNSLDERVYGAVGYGTIHPRWYFNNGFVAIRSKRFLTHWWQLCKSRHFDAMPMREQGFLNVLAHYGDYNVICLDDSDMWHGLCAKAHWNQTEMRDGQVVIPKMTFPNVDKVLKVIHFAGGIGATKMNYKAYFPDAVSAYIDSLLK